MMKLFNMKISGFWSLLFLVAVAALAFFNFLSFNGGSSYSSDLPATYNYGYRTTHIALSRKLKENDMKRTSNNNKVDNGYLLNLDDYPGDNKAVRTAPVEHGTPLQPYIPKPPSPDLPSPPGGDY